MGNHRVGDMFHTAALVIEKEIPSLTQKKALEKLDLVGDFVKRVTTLDAEFDDYTKPYNPLGKWILKAFRPDLYQKFSVLSDTDYSKLSNEDKDIFYKEVYEKFTDRYEFW